jgi:hypothetical protein
MLFPASAWHPMGVGATRSDMLVAAIDTHQALLGRTPRLIAADAAFYSNKNERRPKPLDQKHAPQVYANSKADDGDVPRKRALAMSDSPSRPIGRGDFPGSASRLLPTAGWA